MTEPSDDPLAQHLAEIVQTRQAAMDAHAALRQSQPFLNACRRTETLVGDYGLALNAISLMSTRSPTFEAARLSIRIADLLIESAVATMAHIREGLLNPAHREMRFLLEASIKAWWCDSVEPEGEVERKLDFLDDLGAVIEINSAFTEILGYGPDGLPYLPQHPWWPDPEAEPEAHRVIVDAFAGMPENPDGTYTVPVTHRDGHRVWISASIAHVDDPESGRSVLVGTFRDVTAEHYTVQRQTALAVLNQQLAQADTVDDAMVGAAEQMRQLWRARRVLAATFPGKNDTAATDLDTPEVVCTGEAAGWEELPAQARRTIRALGHSGDLLTADDSMP